MSDDQTAHSSKLRRLALRIRRPHDALVRITVRIVAGLLLPLAFVLFLGLATHQSPSQDTVGSTTKPLTASRPSIVEGFPVPIQASLTPTSKTTSANYLVPATEASLNAWYFDHLEVGKPWDDWGWIGESRTCHGHFLGDASVWQWDRHATVLTLAVFRSNGSTQISIYTAHMGVISPECAAT
jgi:hypothetical protein